MSLRACVSSLLLACLLIGTATAATAPALPAFGADPKQVSVSGLSSGAFMAVQLQVAYSGSIVGAGVIAGGPYYCAANNIFFAGICMGRVPGFPPSATLLAQFAKDFAAARTIDPLHKLAQRRIYVFSGTEDDVVRQPAVDATVAFFRQLGVKAAGLSYVNTLPAGHALITPSFGNDCPANAAPYISHCKLGDAGYDQAGALLQHLHGTLKPRVDPPGGQILRFDQRAFAPAGTGMAETALLYVPQACTGATAHCKVHVAIHGCVQSEASVGNQFVTETGYNAWADSNQMLVLYPQVNPSTDPANPRGCWDWWGYTGGDYAKKSAPQMKAIMAMVKRLTQRP